VVHLVIQVYKILEAAEAVALTYTAQTEAVNQKDLAVAALW
jgi:hypothetical protein